ncbi:MAG: hypothetical protein NZ555_05590 [Geminicoccaceae bacterium]|nr:hypothetical protein [Geminicoccaceae bacterium]MCX8102427.1 hypothetical protein [Geminicoccaceae bacterium]MDW8370811.1 hypothetical protein [Geminicoccaceae bacterium]
MNARPLRAARASRRALLAAVALAALGACGAPRETISSSGRSWQRLLGPVEGLPVVFLLDLEVLELGAAALPTPRAAWTRAAEAEVEAAVQRLAAKHRIALSRFAPDRASEELLSRVARFRAALLAPVRPSPGWGPAAGTSFPAVDTGTPQRPEVGAVSRSLGESLGVDHVLYLLLRETRGTAALAASNLQRLERAQAAQTIPLTTFRPGIFGYAVLVELPTARVIDLQTMMIGPSGPSLSGPADTKSLLEALFRESVP